MYTDPDFTEWTSLTRVWAKSGSWTLVRPEIYRKHLQEY